MLRAELRNSFDISRPVVLQWKHREGEKIMGKHRVRWGRLLIVLILLGGIFLGGRWAAGELGLFDSRITVALDPGHGGDDPGASGVIGETELTETTVRYLEQYLEEDGRFRVVLCREYGEGKDLNSRWRLANRRGADLRLCIHGNSAEDPTARGFEVYPPPPGREYHEESLSFARLTAEEISATGISLRGDGGVRYAYYQEDGSGSTRKVLSDLPDPSLESCPSFAMVDYPDCPAVLIEQCFVTNAEDAARRGTEEGCRVAAHCYYRAVCRYFGEEPAL